MSLAVDDAGGSRSAVGLLLPQLRIGSGRPTSPSLSPPATRSRVSREQLVSPKQLPVCGQNQAGEFVKAGGDDIGRIRWTIAQRTELTTVERENQPDPEPSSTARAQVRSRVTDHPRSCRLQPSAFDRLQQQPRLGLATGTRPYQGLVTVRTAFGMMQAYFDSRDLNALVYQQRSQG